MKKLKTIVVAAYIISVYCAPVRAVANKYESGFNMLYSMPMGKFKNTTQSAAGYGGYGDLSLTDTFSIGGEIFQINYKQKDFNDPLFGPQPSDPGALITAYGLRAKFIRPQNFGSEKGRIYWMLGIASYDVLDAYKAYTAASSIGVARIGESAVGINFGGGFDVEISPQWQAGFELRYHMINKNYSTLNPALKIAYTFGPIVESKQGNAPDEPRKQKRTMRLNEPRSDLPEVTKQESADESDVYATHLSEALNYIAQKDYESAAQEYLKASVSLDDNDRRRVYLYERQGYMAVKVKNYARAKNYYLTAIGAAKTQQVYDKHAVNAFSGLGYCFENTGNIPLAIKNYQKALELTANSALAMKLQNNIKRLRAAADTDTADQE